MTLARLHVCFLQILWALDGLARQRRERIPSPARRPDTTITVQIETVGAEEAAATLERICASLERTRVAMAAVGLDALPVAAKDEAA